MTLSAPELIFWLFIGHAMGDFALQTDWMARFKNRHLVLPDSDNQPTRFVWLHVLTSHCLIHAGAVMLVTGSYTLGLAEFIAHWFIDFFKCEGKYGFHIDQFLHMGCKLIWVALMFLLPGI